ncbi:MAG: hypothetical protein HFF67_01970 [Oscillospiraceae bacterium]|nr:hypothetical protein [Oscillospiraceae bacterium]
MPAMIDLHCDTLTRSRGRTAGREPLDDPAFHLSLSKVPAGTRWIQCFAIFVPDQLRGREAIDFFDRHAASFDEQMAQNRERILPCRSFGGMEAALSEGKFGAVLTVEGGAVLAGQLERVETIWNAGVRMLTLTWNGPNELASGHDTPGGLTDFGREAVAELERRGVLVDVSHLNDRGFEDLLAVAKKPFAASHSNARSVCGHRRNLPDEFIREMAARGGLIGLNYACSFLSDSGVGSLDDLYRHVCRFLELGAGECLALGSDYDGTDIHPDLDSVEKSLGIRDYLVSRGIPAQTADGIVFDNAWRFFRTWLAE